MKKGTSKIAEKEALHKADISGSLRWLKDELKFIKRKVNLEETSVSDCFTFFDAEKDIKKVIKYIESRLDYKQ
jgi:hypothetical protein